MGILLTALVSLRRLSDASLMVGKDRSQLGRRPSMTSGGSNQPWSLPKVATPMRTLGAMLMTSLSTLRATTNLGGRTLRTRPLTTHLRYASGGGGSCPVIDSLRVGGKSSSSNQLEVFAVISGPRHQPLVARQCSHS